MTSITAASSTEPRERYFCIAESKIGLPPKRASLLKVKFQLIIYPHMHCKSVGSRGTINLLCILAITQLTEMLWCKSLIFTLLGIKRALAANHDISNLSFHSSPDLFQISSLRCLLTISQNSCLERSRYSSTSLRK